MGLLQPISAQLWLLYSIEQIAHYWWLLLILLPICVGAVVLLLHSGRHRSEAGGSIVVSPEVSSIVASQRHVAADVAERLQLAEAQIATQQAELDTARRELQRALAASEAVERTKTNFVGSLSHELRTPLTTILGFSEMLQMGTYGRLEPEQAEIVQIVQRSGWHLQQLIDDLLTYAVIEQDTTPPTLAEVELRELIAQVVQAHHPQLTERGLALDLSIDTAIPDAIQSDSESLQQILRCLLSNAARFTEQGRIAVRVRYDHALNSIDTRPWLCVDVEDTGIGIDREHHDHIFEPFLKADMSNTRRRGGTGLGLAIAQRLTHMLGGSITLVSMPGCGSCFTVRIPLVCSNAAEFGNTPYSAGRLP